MVIPYCDCFKLPYPELIFLYPLCLDNEMDMPYNKIKKNGDSLMQVLKDEIRQQIERAAIEVFMEKDFEKALMKEIADRAKISVSNIYNYFESKEKLYDSIVDPAYYQIQELMQTLMENEHGKSFKDRNFTEQFIWIIANAIGVFVKKNRVQLLLLFDKSRGTNHEQLKDGLIEFLERHFTEGLEAGPKTDMPFIMHISATNLVEGLLEIVRHYRSEDWADRSIKDLIRYHISGIAQFLE